MPVVMDIVVCNAVSKQGLARFLSDVYSEYRGSLFSKPVVELTAENQKGFVALTPSDSNFSGVKKYERTLHSLRINGVRNPNLRMNFWPEFGNRAYPAISFEARMLYSATKKESIEVRKWLDDVVGFAKLLMKHSGASYFYGGFEIGGEPNIAGADDVELLYCKGRAYAGMLRAHVKYALNIELSESQIEEIVEETAVIREDADGFVMVYLFRISPGGVFGPRENGFYQAVKTRGTK